MRKKVLALLMTLAIAGVATHAQTVEVRQGELTAITPSLRGWKPNMKDPILSIRTRDEKGLIFARQLQPFQRINHHNGSKGPDPAWQKDMKGPVVENFGAEAANRPSYASVQGPQFDGIGFNNISPGDPTIAVGPSHIIQMVNGTNGSAYFQIFDKNGGRLQSEAFMDQLPGASYNGAGDCITWYDQLTGRFVMTEFGDSSRSGTAVNTLIMAVSASSDPLGAWYVYEFFDASFFPDYPKYSNWHNAWYCTTRDFVGSYIGNSVWAFDKEEMLQGSSSVQVQRIRLINPDQKYSSLCPVSLAGPDPPQPGTPGLFLYFSDDDFSSSGGDADSLGLVSFDVDFDVPSRSTARVLGSLAVMPFRSDICPSRSCAPSASGQGYDVVSTRVMNRPYYRNFGTHESIVATHTVDATGAGVAGLRWYELRKAGADWYPHQQGTFAPQDPIPCVDPTATFRFMGATTLNARGQIALAYNTSRASGYASVGFTGRNSNDPLNAMSYEENIAVEGTDYGTFGNRWGDYNEIVPDPTNDSVFWFTGMYGAPGGWKTSILSFQLGTPKQKDAKLVSIDQPNACESSCRQDVEPVVTIRNTGVTTLTSLTLEYQVGDGATMRFPWTGTITSGNDLHLTLPTVTLPLGVGQFTVVVRELNGSAGDDDPANDSLTTSTSIGQGYDLPILEDFESPLFPSPGWVRRSTLTPAINWERTSDASGSGTSSVAFNNFDNNQPGKYADLRTPLLELSGLDSLELNFLFAGAVFDRDNVDTIEVLVSTDCGESFSSVWRKSISSIATREGNVNTRFIPTASEWERIRIDLNRFTTSGQIIIAMRNINGFGNMVYLDDIRILTTDLPKLDVAMAAISEPAYFTCSAPLKPLVTIQNLGSDTLRSAIISYRINDDLSRNHTWEGILGRRETVVVELPEIPLSTGQYTLSATVGSPNGNDDENDSNDSLRIGFDVRALVSLPVSESFNSPEFPPSQWSRGSSSEALNWSRSPASRTGSGSAVINNFGNGPRGIVSELALPQTSMNDADSAFLEFELSAAAFDPGEPVSTLTDTLEIFLSKDCGKTRTSIYKKWGKALQTIPNADLPISADHVPRTAGDWRAERIDLTKYLRNSDPWVIIFRNHSNAVNNIYLDDISLATKTLPANLKEKGRLVTPNPFQTVIQIQHYPNAASLRMIEVFNSAGQLVMMKKFPSGADSFIQADLGSKPAGLYYLKLTYTDKVETEKLLKAH